MATLGRDWLKTLFPASFNGVPFQTESDNEEGGRRIVTHEFPLRDDPFNEDLGEAKRDFDVTAYVASDNADSEAAALISVCTLRGVGILVLPTHGPLTVRCLTFRRSREKDRAGKIAFTLKFVREGAASALVSILSLANMIFARADAVAVSALSFAQSAIVALGQPDFVMEAAVNALRDGTAAFEAVRISANIDPTVSGLQRNAIQALFDAAPAAFDSDIGVDGSAVAGLIGIARALGDGMDGNAAIPAFEQVIMSATVSPRDFYLSDFAKTADQNRLAVYLVIQLAAATAYAEGIARANIPDRQTATTLRANAAEYFGGILNAMSANDADLYRATLNLQGAVIDYLSRAIIDRSPVISVGANRKMPSLWWAHRLYQDPTRSGELVGRNRVPHPSFMPTDFEALSR
jgi:prophage DNA circulation protein